MPRLPIITPELAPGGAVPVARVPVGGISLDPIAEGLMDVSRAAGARASREERDRQQKAAELAHALKQQEQDEAVMYASKARSDANAEWAARLQKAREGSLGDAPGFTQQALADFDAWVKEREAEAPPAARQRLRLTLTDLRNDVQRDAFQFETASRYAKITSDNDAALDSDRRAVSADPALFQKTLAARLAAIGSLDLPAGTRQKMAVQAREALAFDAAATRADRSPRELVKAFAKPETVAADPVLSALAPERRTALLHHAQTVIRQQDAEARARQAEAASLFREQARDVIDALDKGFPVRPDMLAAVQRGVAGSPLAARLERALGEADAVQQFRLASPAEQRTALNAARAKIDTPEGVRLYQKLEGVAADAERRLKDDGFTYGVAALRVTPAPFDPARPETLVARTQQARMMAERFGQPVSPLTPQESEQLARSLAAAQPEAKAQALTTIATAVRDPGALSALAKQIGPKDRGLELALGMAGATTTNGRPVAELILKGQQAIRDKGVKEDSAAEVGWRARIAKELEGVYPSEQARQAAIDAVRFTLAGMKADGQGEDLPRAVRLVTGGLYEQADGSRVPKPYGWDDDAFESRLRKVRPTDLPADGVLAGGVPIPAEQFIAQLPQASLVATGGGRYVVRAGSGFVTDKQGRRVVLDLNDAR